MSKLHTMLNELTALLRKGEPVEAISFNGLTVITVNAMPHVDEVDDCDEIKIIDMELLCIAVNMVDAEQRKDEFANLIKGIDLSDGPSYIYLGGVLGSQDAAFQFMALGEALNMWKVITPTSLGIKGEQALALAGSGYVMMTPWIDIRR